MDLKKAFFWKNFKILWKKIVFFYKVRGWSNKCSFETSFVEIDWEFTETFDLRYLHGSAADKNAI